MIGRTHRNILERSPQVSGTAGPRAIASAGRLYDAQMTVANAARAVAYLAGAVCNATTNYVVCAATRVHR